MHKTRSKYKTLFRKMVIPFILVIALQSVVFFVATIYGGVSESLNENSEGVLKERIASKKKDFETMFSTKWTDMSSTVKTINNIYNKLTYNDTDKFCSDKELQKELLSLSTESIVSMLRSNQVSGVFLILNNHKEYEGLSKGISQSKYGLCIRDYDPISGYSDREDLLVVRCPSSMMGLLRCSMESYWNALYTFDDIQQGDFFYKPLEMAYKNPDAAYDDLAYFSGIHRYGTDDRQVISYSVPLIDDTGYPYGVLGIELTKEYLKSLMPNATLYDTNEGCYVLAEFNNNTNKYKVIEYNGVLFQQCYNQINTISVTAKKNNMLEFKSELNNTKLSGYASDMKIYNHNTPFENHKLAIIGIVKQDALYRMSGLVKQRIMLVAVLALGVSAAVAFIICKRVTKPIKKLSDKVRKFDSLNMTQFDRLNIREIDELVNSIEELSEKVNRNKVRTEFFSRMSHDMRTPMNAIIGFSSPEMLENADKKQMSEYMDKVHSSGTYLLGLINEILDMTKIEAQRMEIRCDKLDCDFWNSITPIIKEIADEKKVEFDIRMPQRECCFVADKQHLSQVLINLLSNAVKFTKPGGWVEYHVDELRRDDKKVTYTIKISDNGCGMSEEFMKKMYEPFTQEGSSKGGTGLGLAIANQLFTLMNGEMKCESKIDKGTTFNLKISFELSEVTESENKPEIEDKNIVADEEGGVLNGKRVLLCEDHPLNMQIAKRLLERKGMQVEEACNGKVGVELFGKSHLHYYDVVLMDIRMPEMNGLEAARAIRAMEREDSKTVPIIAMTANAFSEDVMESRAAGMNEHLSKPIDPSILYVILKKYLGNN